MKTTVTRLNPDDGIACVGGPPEGLGKCESGPAGYEMVSSENGAEPSAYCETHVPPRAKSLLASLPQVEVEMELTALHEVIRERSEGSMRRQLVTAGDPDAFYPVPQDGEFDDEDDYIESGDLKKIAKALIDHHEAALSAFRRTKAVYLWRRKGGTNHGEPMFGKCQHPTGLLKHFAGVEFVIWLAADHMRDRAASAWTIEAQLFHEMLHAHTDENGKPTVVPHDFQGFGQEVRNYGAWDDVLRFAAKTFEQLPLFE